VDSNRTFADPPPATALGESRSRVLDVLRGADAPFGVRELAGRVGLHPNTARFHLDGLVEAGLVERATEAGGQPGRPRTLYYARPVAAAAGQRSYRLLAEILTTLVAEHLPRPSHAATEVGRTWGGYLIERPAPFERLDPDAAVERLVGVLAEIGFDPEVEKPAQRAQPARVRAGVRLRLRHCPFREVAERHRDVVCSLHLGLMQGALAQLRTPLTADRLDPFVGPNLCIAQVSPPARRGHRERAGGQGRRPT
jgi:predicted ArsR family transcriptional regulator